jgi:hypothetical protein
MWPRHCPARPSRSRAELAAKENAGNCARQRNSSPEKEGTKGNRRAGGGVHQTAGVDVNRTLLIATVDVQFGDSCRSRMGNVAHRVVQVGPRSP